MHVIGDLCATCTAYNDIADGEGECRRYPPHMQMFPIQTPLGQVSMQAICRHVRVKKDNWCKEHQKLAGFA